MQRSQTLRAAGGAVVACGRSYSAIAPDQVRAAFSHCISQLREHDYDNYVWTVQLPKALRPAIVAIRAFFIETELVAQHAKSETLVTARCQWWQSAVNEMYKGNAPDHPVMTALSEVLRSHPLTRYRLQRIVAMRGEVSGQGNQPDTLEELLSQIDGSVGQLHSLQLEAAGEEHAAALEAAQHLGRAVGLTQVLRTTPHSAARGRTQLPGDLTTRHDVSLSALAQGKASPQLCTAAAELAGLAKESLAAARALTKEVPRESRALMLQALPTGLWLEHLEKAGHDLFSTALQHPPCTPLAYQLRLKWAMLRHTY